MKLTKIIKKLMIYWIIITTVTTSCSQHPLQLSMRKNTSEIKDEEQGMLHGATRITDKNVDEFTPKDKKRCTTQCKIAGIAAGIVGIVGAVGAGYLAWRLWPGSHAVGNSTQGISTPLVPAAITFPGRATPSPLPDQPAKRGVYSTPVAPATPKHSCKRYRSNGPRKLNAGDRSKKLRDARNHTTTPSPAQCKNNMQSLFKELVRKHPDMHKVKFLIKESGPLLNRRNKEDPKGFTALMYAAQAGHPFIVDALLDAGAGPDLPNKEGLTPLMLAAINDRSLIVGALLAAGADPDLPDKEGLTALMYAAYKGHLSIVEALIHEKADISLQDNKYYKTALMYAAQRGHKSIVDALIRAKAKLDLQDNRYHRTALMYAAINDRSLIVDALLAAGADPDLPDKEGLTALMYAAYKGHLSIVEALIHAKADINSQEITKLKTALMYATQRGHKSIVDALIRAKAKFDLQDRDNRTALMFAAQGGHSSIINALRAAGADACIQDDQKNTAADLASSSLSNETKNQLKCFHCEWERDELVGFSPFCFKVAGPGINQCDCKHS